MNLIFESVTNFTATSLRNLVALTILSMYNMVYAQQVDYSAVYVREESGLELSQITSDKDNVCMPQVKRSSLTLNWFTNRIIQVSPDGATIAYIAFRNNASNIFIKDLSKQGGSIQRTNRKNVLDFSYSPDGKYIAFSEHKGKETQIFQTDANKGYVCRQITSGANDYSPTYSDDMSNIFFARQEKDYVGIWAFNVSHNYLSTYTSGYNPIHLKNRSSYICARTSANQRSEIWIIDYSSGIDECIVSNAERSFSSPLISPDGQWILMVGESIINNSTSSYRNTDIYVCKLDGTELTQLTYHAADDLSPAWSADGQYIYFISQRGSAEGKANIWRMKFIK